MGVAENSSGAVLEQTGPGVRRLHPESVAVGVEEEFHTVDLATRRLTARADSLVERLPAGSAPNSNDPCWRPTAVPTSAWPISPAVRAELLEAATWRAAQSGLEGDLVDLATTTPVPAHQLIGQLLAGLRPTLEATGDWELVAGLTESALARGSSAARQRAARATGGLGTVVDTLLAETRAKHGLTSGRILSCAGAPGVRRR